MDLIEVIPEWLVVFPTFFNFSLNLAIRGSWSEPQSAPGLVFCWLYRASPSLATNNIINLILVLTIWWCLSGVGLSLVLLKQAVSMTCALSWQNSVSLRPASFCTPRPNLPVTTSISWLPTFVVQSPMVKRTSFLVLVLEGLVGLHRTIQLELLQHCWLGHRPGLLWYWILCLGNEQRSYCHFWDYTQMLHFRLFC